MNTSLSYPQHAFSCDQSSAHPSNARELADEWVAMTGGLSSASSPDLLLHMYEWSRKRIILRDGFIPSHGVSRRASVDSSSHNGGGSNSHRDEVLRQVAEELKKGKSDSASSFIREWIDPSDDPNGILLVSETPVLVSSGGASSSVPSATPSLTQLLDWNMDCWLYSVPDLTKRTLDIFSAWGFFPGISREKFQNFLKSVARNYHAENPYHNFHHAFSVLLVSGNLLRNCVPQLYSQIEEFSILMAALCHDVGHKGLNSDYYVKTRHTLAYQYNDISVLENMHCSLTFDLIRSSSRNDFTKTWSDEEYATFRKIFIQCVLATDMKQHFDLSAKLGELVSIDNITYDSTAALSPEQRKIIYSAIVHAADLSNPTLPTKQCYKWAFKVVEEMHAQGRLEEQAGFAVAPFMKFHPSDNLEFAKLQLSFVGFIVSPLWRSMAALWPSLNSKIDQLNKNNAFWEALRDLKENETTVEQLIEKF